MERRYYVISEDMLRSLMDKLDGLVNQDACWQVSAKGLPDWIPTEARRTSRRSCTVSVTHLRQSR